MKRTALGRILSAAVVFTAAACAFAGDVATGMELTGINEIDVPSGETWTYSGVISGSGSIRKIGAGTLVLTNANTFTGGIDLTNGVIVAAEQGALGTGQVMLRNAASTPKISLRFAKKDAVVENYIRTSNNSSNADNSNPHIMVRENTTFTGNIYSLANTFYFGNENRNKNSYSTAYPTNIVEGDFSTYTSATSPRGVSIATYGVIIFRGKVPVRGTVSVGCFDSSQGAVVLDTDDCSVRNFALHSGSLYCKRKNVLNGAYLGVSRNHNSKAHVDLCGLDQTVAYFYDVNQTSFPATGTGYEINSPSGAATLTVTGGAVNASCTCHFAINDEVTLLLDADPTYTCNFSTRANGTTGDLIVSNGTFAVTDTATFKSVPRIIVAEGGVFNISSTVTEALSGVTELEVSGQFRSTATSPFVSDVLHVQIDEGATFDLGGTLNIASLTMRGVALDEGRYTHLEYEEIAEGTTLVVPAQKRTIAWTGAGADENIATALNWTGGETPNLTGGGLTPVFAEGGSRALIDRLLYLDGLSFAGNGFTLKQDGAAGQVTVAGSSISFAAAEGDSVRTFAFDVPIATAEVQTWNVPPNTTVELKGGFSAAKNVSKSGGGNLTFTGMNAFAGALVISDGATTFAGTVTTPTGVDSSAYTSANAIRCYGATKSGSPGTLTGTVILDNAVIEKPFFTSGPNVYSQSELYLTATANSSNVVRGVWVTADYSWQKLKQPSSATTVFEGGISNIWSGFFSGGTVYVRNKPHISNNNSYFWTTDNVKVFYEAAGGYVKNYYIGDSELNFSVSYALRGGYATNTAQNVLLSLNATTQRFDRVQFPTAARMSIDGEPGSALEVAGSGASCIAADITNGVSLVKFGTGTLTLRNRAFSSTGDLVVTNGTVVVADDANWKGAARVIVSGSGNLTIERTSGNLQSPAFGKRTEVYLSDDSVISIPDGSEQRVAYLFVDGVRQPTGRYTYATIANANVKKHFAATTGVLKCSGTPGMMISFR